MSSKVTKILTIILWVMLALSAVFIVLLLDKIDTPQQDSMINLNLRWAYVLFGIAALVAVGFAVYQMFSSAEKAKKSLMAIGVLAVVVIIASLLASTQIPNFYGAKEMVQKGTLTPEVAKFTDTLLYTTYILFGGAVLSVIYSGLSRFWK
jgi:peptidoglycan/LPS O-acetylase OafA/YrhL